MLDKNSGRLVIQGFAYEDIVSILIHNGYYVQVSAKPSKKNISEVYFIIDYDRSKEWDNLE